MLQRRRNEFAGHESLSIVMPGQKREARLRADDPGIHVFLCAAKTWMAGTGPAMTENVALSADTTSTFEIADVTLIADLSGALYWEDQNLLVVSDLHLEKGSSFAARGVLLPPYDTAATLSRLAAVIARHDPRMVIALGDSFHDRHAHERLSADDRDAITALQARRDWIWISGNHDPALPPDLGGMVATEVAIGKIAFRHEPTGAFGEIAGHLHPKARVPTRGRTMERRCFATDGDRAVMPAFGAYTGGLSIRDAAFAKIFGTPGFTAHVLGDIRLHTIAASRCY
jgi:DNA ligase-associated metallophosphoesterase